MEVIKENTKELSGKLRIKLSEDDYTERVDKQLRELRKKVQMKGFRPGKVPLNLIKKMYGKDVLVEEITKLVDEIIDKFQKENNYTFISKLLLDKEETKFDIEKNKDYEFVYEYAFYPEYDLKLEELKIPYYKIIPSEKEIEERIEQLRSQYGKNIEEEQICEDCSFVIDVVELDENGEPKKEGIKVEQKTVILKYLTDKGKEIFKGKKKGDKIKINPKDAFGNETDLSTMLEISKDDLDKISDTFEITITRINKFVPAEINEEFYEKVFGKDKVHNEEELKEAVKEMLLEEYKLLANNLFEKYAKYFILDKADFDLPLDFIKEKLMFDIFTEEKKNTIIDYFKWNYIFKLIVDKLKVDFDIEDVYAYLAKSFKDNFAAYSFANIDDSIFRDFAVKEFEKMDAEKKEEVMRLAYDLKIINLLKDAGAIEEKEISYDDFLKKIDEINEFIAKKYNASNSDTQEEESKEKAQVTEEETNENNNEVNNTESETQK